MADWQPIETLPFMDHVLLWFPKGGHVIALVDGPGHIETIGYLCRDDEPTHWLPLPTPPVEAVNG